MENISPVNPSLAVFSQIYKSTNSPLTLCPAPDLHRWRIILDSLLDLNSPVNTQNLPE